MKKVLCVILVVCCLVGIVGCSAVPTQLTEEQKAHARMLCNWSGIWQMRTSSGDLVNTIAIREVNGKEYLLVGRMSSSGQTSGSSVSLSYGVTWVFEVTEKGVREIDEDSVPGLPSAGLVLTGESGTRWDALADQDVKVAAMETALLKSLKNKK